MDEQKPTLLIVDDEIELLASLERPLKIKYQVITTNKSTDVVERLKSQHIDCILLDIQMPELSGLDLLKEIKFTYPHIPILIMTGHGNQEDATQALKYGASGYIKKPIDIYLLFDEIKRILIPNDSDIKRPAKILLVDEDKKLINKLELLLKEHGYDVTKTMTAEKTLSILDEQFYDIILLDIQMKNMEGFKFIENIQRRQPNIIPIVITHYNTSDIAIEAIKHQVFDLIKKPFDINDLISSIKRSMYRLEINREVLQKNRELTAKEKMLQSLNDEILLQKNYLATMTAAIGNIVIITDENGNINSVNEAATHLLGYNNKELVNLNISSIFNVIDVDKFMAKLLQDKGAGNTEGEIVKKDKKIGHVLYSSTLVRNEQIGNIAFAFVAQDISHLKKVEANLQQISYYDSLTKLPNQLYFEVRAKQLLAHHSESEKIAFLYFDLDGFKAVNDRLGHTIGDGLLNEVAKRFQIAFRDEDFVARVNGDKFIACLTKIKDNAYVGIISQRIISSINRPYFIDGNEISVGLSVGIAVFPDSANGYEDLLKNADMALYKAKQSGRNQFQYYTRQIHLEYGNQLELQNDLRFAIMRNEFKLAYQPILNLKNQKVVSLEALIRWEHKTRGMVSPTDFIPLAETLGLIIPIGEWVVEAAIKQYARWQARGIADFKLSINISAWQLDRGRYLVDLLKNTCDINDVSPKSIELELTETAIMHNPSQGEATLQQLNQLGFSIVIDDFGQGFSSLSLLSRLPIDTLKIDRQFIAQLNEEKNESIIKSIVSLSQSLNIAVVAEGIETEVQRDYLLKLGCDYGQGYLFAKPAYPEQLFPN